MYSSLFGEQYTTGNNKNFNSAIRCPIYYDNNAYGGSLVSDISTFTNINFGSIRTINLGAGVYFCLRDICKALGFENEKASMYAIIKDLDSTTGYNNIGPDVNPYNYSIPAAYYKVPTPVEKTVNSKGHISSTTQMYNMVYVNESALYRIIFKSNKPQAVEFQNWIYNDVLPRIRLIGKNNFNNGTRPKFYDPDFLSNLKSDYGYSGSPYGNNKTDIAPNFYDPDFVSNYGYGTNPYFGNNKSGDTSSRISKMEKEIDELSNKLKAFTESNTPPFFDTYANNYNKFDN